MAGENKPRFEKGARAAVLSGKAPIGTRGEIFWTGPNRYGPGFRYGLKSADGATYWVDEADLGPEEGAPPEPPPRERTGPVLEKGDRVRIVRGKDGVGQEGEVFWTGESRFGAGMRYGVKNEAGDTFWVDEEVVEALPRGAPRPEKSAAAAGTRRADPGSEWPADPDYSAGADPHRPPEDDAPFPDAADFDDDVPEPSGFDDEDIPF
jgi:hypothetical protein